jgi:hypothetical protein
MVKPAIRTRANTSSQAPFRADSSDDGHVTHDRGIGMSDSTRRTFLAVAGAGTVAGVAAVAAPSAANGAVESEALPRGAQGAMAAYIHDVHRGEVLVMVEGREVIVTDHRLVARLARAFARAADR